LCGEACQYPCSFVFLEVPAHHAITKPAALKLIIAPNRAESISISLFANPHLAASAASALTALLETDVAAQ
jgi:hypothetical protein